MYLVKMFGSEQYGTSDVNCVHILIFSNSTNGRIFLDYNQSFIYWNMLIGSVFIMGQRKLSVFACFFMGLGIIKY